MAVGLFDTKGADGPTTETFQAQGAGAGEQFQHPGADNALTQPVEHGLLHPVRCGPKIQSFGHFQNPAGGLAACDAHVGN